MTVREVANYLRLSEKTVSRMAQEGRIPAQKLAHQWRFQRSSIDSWMANRAAIPADEQQLSPEDTGLPAALTVANVITPARISLNLTAPDKNGVLRELCALVLDPREERLFETLLQALRAREDLCPTCITEGVAIPHARNALVGLVDSPVLAYGRHNQGIDFGALDGKPVYHFFLLCAPNVRQHLQLLSRLARLVNNADFRAKLMTAKLPDDVLAMIREAEDRLVPH
ncbi:MAG TPA: PTS sugar transporter subunit IIA [Verrucomicrobiae bacterium]|nr:PTS sugar transporter subunit IIA [Verrucomicrobiae bacterium]